MSESSEIKPEQIEVIEPTTEQLQTDPVASAAMMFGLYYVKFAQLVDKLSNKSLRRLIKSLIASPLEDVKPNFKINEERVAFSMGERLFESKMVIVLDTMYNKQKEIEKLKVGDLNQTLSQDENTNQEETKNG